MFSTGLLTLQVFFKKKKNNLMMGGRWGWENKMQVNALCLKTEFYSYLHIKQTLFSETVGITSCPDRMGRWGERNKIKTVFLVIPPYLASFSLAIPVF